MILNKALPDGEDRKTVLEAYKKRGEELTRTYGTGKRNNAAQPSGHRAAVRPGL